MNLCGSIPMSIVSFVLMAMYMFSSGQCGGTETAPYPRDPSADVLGRGFDASYKGEFKTSTAIDPQSTVSSEIFNNEIKGSKQLIYEAHDARTFLSVDTKASMGYGKFSASASASFSREVITSARSFNLVALQVSMLHKAMYSRPRLSESAIKILKKDVGQFIQTYGQYFVLGIWYGSSIMVRETITLSSESVTQKIRAAAKAEGSFGAFSASVETAVNNERSNTDVTMTQTASYFVEGVDTSCVFPANPSVAPSEIDTLLTNYKACMGKVDGQGGVPKVILFGRYDELEDWALNVESRTPIQIKSSIFDIADANLGIAADYVHHYESVIVLARQLMNQAGLDPTLGTKLRELQDLIAADVRKIIDAIPASNLTAVLKEVPFWTIREDQLNKLNGGYAWSNCKYRSNTYTNELACSGSQVVVAGGMLCQTEYDDYFTDVYTINERNKLYGQCMNHDDNQVRPPKASAAVCCEPTLISNKCRPISSSDSLELTCNAAEVLVSVGGICHHNKDQLFLELYPANQHEYRAKCVNHDRFDFKDPPQSLTGYCCSVPAGASVRVVASGAHPSDAYCAPDELVIGGGAKCKETTPHNFPWVIRPVAVIKSMPSSRNAWTATCANLQSGTHTAIPETVYAVCMRFQDSIPLLKSSAHVLLRPSGAVAASAPPWAAEFETKHIELAIGQSKLLHFHLQPIPNATVVLSFASSCSPLATVTVGPDSTGVVGYETQCSDGRAYGKVTLPAGVASASLQLIAGRTTGFGILRFVDHIQSEDPNWQRHATSIPSATVNVVSLLEFARLTATARDDPLSRVPSHSCPDADVDKLSTAATKKNCYFHHKCRDDFVTGLTVRQCKDAVPKHRSYGTGPLDCENFN